MAGGGYGSDAVVVMPMWKRASITGIQLLMTLITAGVIIGYGQLYLRYSIYSLLKYYVHNLYLNPLINGIYPMLVSAGVYHHHCPDGADDSDVCPAQEAHLDQLFNIGASVSIFVQAPSGIVLDFMGPRITCWIGLALFIPGCFLFAFANTLTSIDAYMFGFQLLAAGGPFVFISSMPVSQLWPDKKAMILMMINGVYGGGAFVFFLFQLLNDHVGVSMKSLFIGYGILGCFIVIVAAFVWPRRSYAESNKKPGTSIQEVYTDETRLSPVEIITKSLRDITTVPYIYLAPTIAFLIFKSNYFLSTSNQQWSEHLTADQLSKYNALFGVVLPAIGMVAGPIGIIFDKFGENVALILLIILSTLSSVCGMIIHTSTEVFGALTVIRMFIFSAYYPMIYGVWAFFIVANFGTKNFGVLYGLIAIVAGFVNLFASNPLVNYAVDSSSGSFFKANLLLVSIGSVFIVYPIIMYVYSRVRPRHGSGYYPI